jgi:UDP-2,3-diacylglucosamine hydrolase
MSPDTLREGAILVADAHCAPWRTPFIDFLRALESGAIVTPQLVLMGDIFDLLFGPIDATCRLNAEAIDLLNTLSGRFEIVYLEGNHDFRLSSVFPLIRVIPRAQQPWIATFGETRIALSHGDTAMGKGYALYTALIRNPVVLHVLRLIDRLGNGFIVRGLVRAMGRKRHCRTIEDFEEVIRRRMRALDYRGIDLVIEGHFHQNRRFEAAGMGYVSLGAFACNERYFSVQSSDNQPQLLEAIFRKEP